MLNGESAGGNGERRERGDGYAEHNGSTKPTPPKPHAPRPLCQVRAPRTGDRNENEKASAPREAGHEKGVQFIRAGGAAECA